MSHQREAITDELAQFSDLRRGNPALGQAPEAQHGGQVLGIALVVLHPPIAPVVAERMRQMHGGPEFLEDVGGPVPAIGGLEDDLRRLACFGHDLSQLEGLAHDLPTGEHLAVSGHPDNRGGPAVQVDSHVLSLHRGLPCRGLGVRTPSIATLGSHGERRPRSFIASVPSPPTDDRPSPRTAR